MPSPSPLPSAPRTAPVTYLLVDGENIDATLGNSVLRVKPTSEQRPRWERVREFVENAYGTPVKALFFLNASTVLPLSFVQALLSMDYRPIPLAGPRDEKIVDIAISRTLAAIRPRTGNVVLASHDGDFLADVTALLGGGRQVAVIGFREFVNSQFRELESQGLRIYDLEDDARCFNVLLPRVRVIPIADYDPERFL